MTVFVEPDGTLDEDTVTVDCESETDPAVTVIVGKVEVTALPPIVLVMVVAVPAVVPVNCAVYVPSP